MAGSSLQSDEKVQQKSIRKIWQRVCLMEVRLQEMRSENDITQERFKARMKEVGKTKSRLKQLKHQLEFEEILTKKPASLDFPPLEKLSALEFSSVEDYFDQRSTTAQELSINLSKISPWVEKAAQGQSLLFSTFRLSKLKRFQTKIQEEIKKVKLDIQLQKKLLRKLTFLVKGTPMVQGTTALKQAIQAFTNSGVSRKNISILEKQINEKRQEVNYMKNWLSEAKSIIRRKVAEPSPTLSTLQSVNENLEIFGIDKINRSFERTSLAQVYIQSYEKRHGTWDDSVKEGNYDGT